MKVLNALILTRKPSISFVSLGLFWGCFAAYVPDLKMKIDVNDITFGLLLMCNAFGLVVSMWLAPKLDRILGNRGLQLSTALLGVVFFLPGFAFDAFTFGLSMTIVGAAHGVAEVIMNTRVSELEQLHKRPLMNASHGMFSLSYAAGAIASGFARQAHIDAGTTFLIVGFLILVMSTFLKINILKKSIGQPEFFNYPVWPILICGSIVMVAFMTEATVEAWSAIHIERTLEGKATQGALGPAMLGITMAIGRFLGQSVSEAFSEYRLIIGATIVTAVGAIIVAWAPTPVWAYFGFGTLGLGVSVIGPTGLALVGKYVPDHFRTEAISRVALMGFAGFFLAPALMGIISELQGLRIAFLCTGVLGLVCIPLTLLLGRLQKI